MCRQTLSELGLPTPGYAKIPVSLSGEPDKIKQLVQNLSYPLISKPMDKYGSRGIYIIYDERELAEQVTRTAEFTDLEEVLVEEYNDGFEFNMMTWVNGWQSECDQHCGQREDTAGGRYASESVREMLIRPGFFRDVYEPARDLLQSYIAHTGQMDGPLSMQFFWKPGKGIQVCEIAARFFGYEHELTDMVYGFNIEELLLGRCISRRKKYQRCSPDMTFFIRCIMGQLYISMENFARLLIRQRHMNLPEMKLWPNRGSFIRRVRLWWNMDLIHILHYII